MANHLRACAIAICLLGPAVAVAPGSAALTGTQEKTPQTGGELSKDDRKRVEGYGAAFVNGVNATEPADQAKAVGEVFASGLIAQAGEERLLQLFERLRREYGKLELHHAEIAERQMGTQTSRVLHVYVRTAGQKNWKDIQFRLEPEAPFKISKIAFIADVAEPVYLPNGSITDPETHKWITGYIDKLVAENGLSGSVLIAVGDKPVYERLFGSADAEGRKPITGSTRFNLGSGNKMFTALAIARLVEKGVVKYSDPLIKYFPDFPDPAFARKATVHHLLSHTSGVNEYWTEDFDQQRLEIQDVRQMLPWVYKVGTSFEPGSRFAYSNSNFVLAGLIVERASGKDYFSYVRNNITEPLGMTQTESYYRDAQGADLAAPLKKGEKGWELAIPLRHGRGSSAGGGYSTARDMLKFARGLLAGKIVNPATLREMTSPKTVPESETQYGYGFILSRSGNVASFGHGGIAPGVNFEFQYFPSEDITLVTFCNQDNGAYDDLRRNLVKLISGAR